MIKLLALIILVLGLPISILFNAKQHTIREHAAIITPTPLICGNTVCKQGQHCGFTNCPTQPPQLTYYPCDHLYTCIDDTSPTPPLQPTNSISSTPTISPNGSSLSLTLFLHGIGYAGDNANPNSQGNTNPLHPDRNVNVFLYDFQNNLVSTKQGTVHFYSTAGNFQGTTEMGNLADGQYIIKVHTDGFLNRLVSGIITVSATKTTTVPAIYLVNGDVNNDNKLDILDYNNIVSCFGSKATSSSCTNNNGADLDDEGTVDGIDYNLFLRELSVQNGDGGPTPSSTPTPQPTNVITSTPTSSPTCYYQDIPCTPPATCIVHKLVCPSTTPSPTQDCTPRGSCLPVCNFQATCTPQLCPTGTVCSGMPVNRCYPIGCPYPICLASNTKIATPQGDVLVTNLKEGMIIWTLDKQGHKIAEPVLKVTSTTVSSTHMVVHIVLSDRRQVYTSKGHPTTDGRTVDQLHKGDTVDGSLVYSTELIPYWDTKTYDLLPDGETGYYFANGIPLGSTLK